LEETLLTLNEAIEMKLTNTNILHGILFSVALLLSACGGGGGGGGTAPNSTATGQSSVLTETSSSVPVATCPNGGISVDAGIDSNNNKVLDASEVTSTQYVCNGSNGLSTLVLITNEAAGANCSNGGKKVEAGKDANSNSILEASEVTTSAYVCNGANGGSGTSAHNSLVSIVPESAGIACTYGGNKVSSGVDSNSNGILDASEVTASNFVCNGAPGATGPAGAGLTWVNVTGASVQAASNTGYLANSVSSQVVLTLPATPAIGDIVQVTGVGSRGWKVVPNAGQAILAKGATAFAWTARESSRVWQSVASSADGNYLVAVVKGGLIYTSTDAGANWNARAGTGNWQSVASSADGNKLVAVDYGGLIYTSIDAGMSWTTCVTTVCATPRNWQSVASSADGSKLVAAVYGGQIYTSIDSGVTWVAQAASGQWYAVASSADGSKLIAADHGLMGVGGGLLWVSLNSGVTWAATATPQYWTSVASSADGSKLVAGASTGGDLWTSSDSGLNWTSHSAGQSWSAVASSADGSKLIAAHYGDLWASNDSGLTWAVRPVAGAVNWTAVASSADGSKLLASSPSTPLYTSAPSTTTSYVNSLSGAQYDSVDLQCVGTNTFMVRGYVGQLVVQ
jgi:hypothetical protein